jgi:polygalacturonase
MKRMRYRVESEGLSMRMFAICSVLVLVTTGTFAQDARTVTEPKIPAACVVLTAELAPHHGELSDAEERGHRDNARIEQALANCAPGKAVVLRAGKGDRTVFLIAPMKLHAGVTLVLEAKVGVWGSRDPRDYDVAPGSCGLVAEARRIPG